MNQSLLEKVRILIFVLVVGVVGALLTLLATGQCSSPPKTLTVTPIAVEPTVTPRVEIVTNTPVLTPTPTMRPTRTPTIVVEFVKTPMLTVTPTVFVTPKPGVTVFKGLTTSPKTETPVSKDNDLDAGYPPVLPTRTR
jgi:hypothetical protein